MHKTNKLTDFFWFNQIFLFLIVKKKNTHMFSLTADIFH